MRLPVEKINTKSELLEKVKAKRLELEEVIKSIPSSRLAEPGVENNWSVKDILAHISRWEQMMCEWIRDLQAGITPNRPPPGTPWEDLDQINAGIFEENRHKSLSSVQAEFDSSYTDTLRFVESIPEEDLFEPGRFEWTNGNPVWYLVGANTFWHYDDHISSLRNWANKLNEDIK